MTKTGWTRRYIVAFLASAMLTLMLGSAAADPSFGSGGSDGQGNNGPNEVPNQCHPPGQTSDLPQCP